MEWSLNYQEFTHVWSDQSLILILDFLLTSCFLNSLNFLYFSNSKSSPTKTIHLKVSITMAFETLFTLHLFSGSLAITLPLVKGFDWCRGSVSFVGVGVTIGGTLRANKEGGLKGLLAPYVASQPRWLGDTHHQMISRLWIHFVSNARRQSLDEPINLEFEFFI